MEASGSDARPDLLSLQAPEAAGALARHFRDRGQGGYRVAQTLAWLHERDATSFEEMTDLPVGEREALADRFRLATVAPSQVQVSRDGTTKHLWRLGDGELIESVLIPAGDRLTLCISSQAGCAMACVFCATGWSGYRRQLTAGEIVGQFRGSRRWLAEHDRGSVTNIVFMGMGEPLANLDAVLPALGLLNAACGVGARRITVSTVGIIPGILALARRPEQFRLAVSLHAPTPELRAEIVPIERRYPLPELMEALRVFDAAGGRRITFEYVMIREVNDMAELVPRLAALALPFGAHVNLIPYNPIPGVAWRASHPDRIRDFARGLEERRVRTTIREPRGSDIAAACGQLRAEHELRAPRPYLQLRARREKAAG